MSDEVCPDDGTNLVHFDEQDLVGNVLDNRYTILARVGKGGMGVVYKAEQHLIGRIVALKVLNKEIVKDETAVKRFLNEARAIASLENTHTVTLYDFGVTTTGLLYYTMELLDGRPLSSLLQSNGPLPVEQAVEIIFQTLESLGEAHDKGILHRDIKPDNLFLQARTSGERVKVLDFGIAKLVGEGGEGTAITKTGMICGTPQYLSPEQVLGNPAVPASDLYSLGVVFYEMVAGMPPFFSPTPMKMLLKHLNEIPPPISVRNPKVIVPPSINRFVERVLAKQPTDRYSSVAEFRLGLEEAVAQIGESTDGESLTALMETGVGVRALHKSAATTPPRGNTADLLAMGDEETQPVPGDEEDRGHGEARPKPGGASRGGLPVTRPLPGHELDEEVDSTAQVVERFAGNSRWAGVGVAALIVAVGLLVWQPWSTPGVEEAPVVKKAGGAGGADSVVSAAPAARVDPGLADVVAVQDTRSAEDLLPTQRVDVQPEVAARDVVAADMPGSGEPLDAGVELRVADMVPAERPDIALAEIQPETKAEVEKPPGEQRDSGDAHRTEKKPDKKPDKRPDKKPYKRPDKKPDKKPEEKPAVEKPASTGFKRIGSDEPAETETPAEVKKPSGFRRIPTN